MSKTSKEEIISHDSKNLFQMRHACVFAKLECDWLIICWSCCSKVHQHFNWKLPSCPVLLHILSICYTQIICLSIALFFVFIVFIVLLLDIAHHMKDIRPKHKPLKIKGSTPVCGILWGGDLSFVILKVNLVILRRTIMNGDELDYKLNSMNKILSKFTQLQWNELKLKLRRAPCN